MMRWARPLLTRPARFALGDRFDAQEIRSILGEAFGDYDRRRPTLPREKQTGPRWQAAFSYALHYDMPSNRPISFFSYLGGLVSSTVWVGLFIGSIGWVFNRLSRSGRSSWGSRGPRRSIDVR